MGRQTELAAQQNWRITLSSGESFLCREDESVLAAMTRARVGPVRCGCFGGGCGVCKMRVAAGEYYRFQKMSRAHISTQEEQAGVVLLCCIRPLSDLALKLATQ